MSGKQIELADVVLLLQAEYNAACKFQYVRRPLAYALYRTWKKVDTAESTKAGKLLPSGDAVSSGITCPACASGNVYVVETRPQNRGTRRRRYECKECGGRFNTTEGLTRDADKMTAQAVLDELRGYVDDLTRKVYGDMEEK